MMVGIRADESLNRFMTISSQRKLRFADDKPWTTSAPGGHTPHIYPIYDWKTADIWIVVCKAVIPITPLRSDVSGRGAAALYAHLRTLARSSQGLWLYHVLEPERWAAICQQRKRRAQRWYLRRYDNKFMATATR